MTESIPHPTPGPNEASFWDASDLLTEERRQFDVCNGCRLCWNLCPAFPRLFDVAESVDGDLEQVGREQFDSVEALCFQCKLCWVVCPYTDPAGYNLDIPRLIERSKFVRARKDGIPLSKRLVADQDRLAKLAGGIKSPLTNLANRFGPTRRAVGLIADVHPDALLPSYHRQTFSAWFRERYGDAIRPSSPARKVAFFASCTIDYNEPAIGKACVAVLERNNVEVIVPDPVCCGMPLTDVGDYAGARKKMDYNLDRLVRLVDEGYDIVVPQPTCTLVLRDDYPLRSTEAQGAARVAEHTFEFGHYLANMAREGLLDRAFSRGLGTVGFHVACHTRRLSLGNNSARLLGIVPETTVQSVESCSGHDGVWGVSRQYFPLALKVGERLFNNFNTTSPDLLVSDCPLAARHIEIGTGRRPIHTAQALAAAYGLPEAPENVGRPRGEALAQEA